MERSRNSARERRQPDWSEEVGRKWSAGGMVSLAGQSGRWEQPVRPKRLARVRHGRPKESRPRLKGRREPWKVLGGGMLGSDLYFRNITVTTLGDQDGAHA